MTTEPRREGSSQQAGDSVVEELEDSRAGCGAASIVATPTAHGETVEGAARSVPAGSSPAHAIPASPSAPSGVREAAQLLVEAIELLARDAPKGGRTERYTQRAAKWLSEQAGIYGAALASPAGKKPT